MTQPNHCARCGKWAGAHATLPGQSTDHLCMCAPAPVEKAAPSEPAWKQLGALLGDAPPTPRDEWPADAAGALGHLVGMLVGHAPSDEIGHCVSLLNGALSAQQAAQPVASVPQEKWDALLAQEHALSDAYVRLREIIGAMNPPAVSDPQALWAYVEGVARDRMAAQPVAGEPVAWTPGPNVWKDWCSQWFGPDADDAYLARAVYALPPMAQRFAYTAAPAPVGTDKDSLTVAPAGRLHADGYFTWHRRDGYVMDRRLPCDFYLAPVAAPAPVGLVPLTEAQTRALVSQHEVYQYHPGALFEFTLAVIAEFCKVNGIKAGTDGAK